MKKTKIIATLGPACNSLSVLARMHRAGMNAVRINIAHGEFSEYDEYLKKVRALGDVPVIVDIKGPEVRVRCSRPLAFKAGAEFEVGFSQPFDPFFTYNFVNEVKAGEKVLFNNGLFSTQIVEKRKSSIMLLANEDGVVEDRKGVNIPGARLRPPELSAKDKKAIDWVRQNNIEFIALSFTRSAEDVLRLRNLLKCPTGILAKVENQEGVENIKEIASEADGVMVARGDLGVEISQAKIPVIQKMLLKECNEKAKIAITATQMLESMISNSTPTRAEASDIANAILDGTDAIMLSGETAVGKYPVKVIEVMTAVAQETEPFVKRFFEEKPVESTSHAVSAAVSRIVSESRVSRIVCITRSGFSAKSVSSFRPRQDILAVTQDALVKRQLELVYGVQSFHCPDLVSGDKVITAAKFLLEKKALSLSDRVVFTAGFHTRRTDESNVIEIHEMRDLKDFFTHREVASNL